ncbi:MULTISPECIES: hypothetical protein [Butyricimonas]|uniref:Uncharacterized protein n=1 Tax=Butyricimonas faecihominis TaxID=1472416 RepID=A0A7W6MXK4_9BACT|nr:MULTISPECIES: hypothetical protein [Butyricimonas]MBB4024966.1 hypothetical protein [Butyricimonas faecihominis]
MASSPCGTLVRVSNGSFHENQSAMPRTAGVSGNVQVEKGIKNAGSRWTARKVKECTLLGYSLLGENSLPKSLPIRSCHGYR